MFRNVLIITFIFYLTRAFDFDIGSDIFGGNGNGGDGDGGDEDHVFSTPNKKYCVDLPTEGVSYYFQNKRKANVIFSNLRTSSSCDSFGGAKIIPHSVRRYEKCEHEKMSIFDKIRRGKIREKAISFPVDQIDYNQKSIILNFSIDRRSYSYGAIFDYALDTIENGTFRSLIFEDDERQMKQFYRGLENYFVYRYNLHHFKYCGVDIIGRCAMFCYEILATKKPFEEEDEAEGEDKENDIDVDSGYSSTKGAVEKVSFPVPHDESSFSTNIEIVGRTMDSTPKISLKAVEGSKSGIASPTSSDSEITTPFIPVSYSLYFRIENENDEKFSKGFETVKEEKYSTIIFTEKFKRDLIIYSIVVVVLLSFLFVLVSCKGNINIFRKKW